MRYRIELLDSDDLVVRNVETDLVMARVDRDGFNRPGVSVFDMRGKEIGFVPPGSEVAPLKSAAAYVASYEEGEGYPDLKPLGKAAEPKRIEFQLGELMADAATQMAKGACECWSGKGLQSDTKHALADTIAQIFPIAWASSFDSFDAEKWMREPYFASLYGGKPRMRFFAAAEQWGTFMLRIRFNGSYDLINEDWGGSAQKLISWCLEIIDDVFRHLRPAVPINEAEFAQIIADCGWSK